jgi:hypothetical protein
VSGEPVDLSNQAVRNAELRRLFAKPTVRLADDDHPGVFDVYVLDERSREERKLGSVPGADLARLLACLPDGAGPSGVTVALCCYRIGSGA